MNLIFDLDDTLYNLMGPFELVHKKLYADKTDADCTQLFMQSRVYSDEIMEAEKKGLIPHEDCFYERVKRTYHDVGIEMSREDADIFEQLYRSFQKKITLGNGVGEDLIRVLEEGHLKGAVLDVFETEPLPETSPLWNMENVLITPHIAGPSFGGNAEVQDMIWNICMENMERYLNGKKLKNIVRLKDGY